jgi:two-component system, OmpR family, phosphate regulon response regulator PhoB
VLICEDEENLRELMRASLDTGYRFLDAATVAEADEVLQRTRPDVVLLDLMLPGGSGLDVLRTIRRRPGPPIPVVVVSAWTTGDYREAAREAGANAFVPKPFEPEQLAAVVSGLLEAASG